MITTMPAAASDGAAADEGSDRPGHPGGWFFEKGTSPYRWPGRVILGSRPLLHAHTQVQIAGTLEGLDFLDARASRIIWWWRWRDVFRATKAYRHGLRVGQIADAATRAVPPAAKGTRERSAEGRTPGLCAGEIQG